MNRSSEKQSYIESLEEAFIIELVVAHRIYGSRSTAQREWARLRFDPAQDVGSYMVGWKSGKDTAWRRLARMADDIRAVTGDSEELWEERLSRLEMAANHQVQEVQPTSSMGFFDIFPSRSGG